MEDMTATSWSGTEGIPERLLANMTIDEMRDQSHLTDFICVVCNNLVANPVMTECDHFFCRHCITRWIREGDGRCPHRCGRITEASLKPIAKWHRSLRRTYNNIDIRCIACADTEHAAATSSAATTAASAEGCTWTGKLDRLRYHRLHECLWFGVACPNTGCEVVVRRKDLPLHVQQQCEFLPVTCEYCQTRMQRRELAAHMCEECAAVPGPCQYCPFVANKATLREHVATDCPGVEVKCRFPGCSERMPRRALPGHVKASVETHLGLLLKAHTDQSDVVQTQHKQLQKQNELLRSVKAQNEALQVRLRQIELLLGLREGSPSLPAAAARGPPSLGMPPPLISIPPTAAARGHSSVYDRMPRGLSDLEESGSTTDGSEVEIVVDEKEHNGIIYNVADDLTIYSDDGDILGVWNNVTNSPVLDL